jgi:molybdate transport system regulatory protein
MTTVGPWLKLKAQLLVGDEIAFGPGKADLLEAIAAEGSISAAGRAMKISYRRAWLMVDAMNRLFAEPLVSTNRGAHSGASLTTAGQQVLASYRALERAMASTGSVAAAELINMLRVSSRP